ncbi:MAG: N-acetylglucosamine-6-phosphate deacetylase [Clostridia bacterium]|nr:N-acetylglucosamine-6-phosphate deacetylase [Clostridia bacterium]
MITKIINGSIITDRVEKNKYLYLENDKVLAVTDEEIPADSVIDANGNYVSPGFVDIHTHGAGGADFMDGTPEDVKTALRAHLAHGTTAIMPTTTTANPSAFRKALEDIRTVMQANHANLPHVLGAHLEGPYLSGAQSGAQVPQYMKAPMKEEYTALIKEYGDVIKRWTFAPENEGALEFCQTLIKNDIVPSIGHTDATYQDILPVYEAGCRLMTHFYSGMSLLKRKNGFRVLGAVETGYLLDDMRVETIADGKHLPPELLRLIYKVKSAENICMVTDSMRGAGVVGLKKMYLGPIADKNITIIEDGVAKMPDRQNFAGSIATTDRLVRVMHKEAGIDIVKVVEMLTRTPAKAMGIDKIGSLMPGYYADVVFFDHAINVSKVLLHGIPQWEKEHEV